jgi:fatty acid synthase
MLKRPECAFVAVVAVHIALVEILATIGIFPTGYLGHSIGELTCAYISGFFSLQETIRCAYRLGFVASSCPGSMAAIGISSQRFCESEHPNVFLACDNSKDSITVSGSAASVSEYVALKKKEGVLATVIDSAGVAFHSPTLIPASNEMRRALSGILGTKRFPRPAQWLSTSQTSRGALFSSEYLVQNLLQPSMFSSAMAKLPPNAAVFEIGATPILASFIKSALPEARCVVAPMTRKSPSKLTLATALANAFSAGGVDVHSLAFLCG